MHKINWLIIFALLTFGSNALADKIKQNINGRSDTYTLGTLEAADFRGNIVVQSEFVEEPVRAPYLITVTATCKNSSAPQELARYKVYDYGMKIERTLLSTFDTNTETLKVYYVTASINAEGRTEFKDEVTENIDLSSVCKATE